MWLKEVLFVKTLYSTGVCHGVVFSLVLSHYTPPILRKHMSMEICQENDTKYFSPPGVHISKGQSSELQWSLRVASVRARPLGN